LATRLLRQKDATAKKLVARRNIVNASIKEFPATNTASVQIVKIADLNLIDIYYLYLLMKKFHMSKAI
jgi:hypothetical protein